MCGITGFSSLKYFDQLNRSLSNASTRLAHRGPNDRGSFSDENAGIGLAHQRLSVIDLTEKAHQPMSNDSTNLLIVYNGEVYNYKRIRESLIRAGHRFESESDTEVILKAYEEWGVACFKKLNGMFALAIWDSNLQQLVLARDRLGIKPLYYYAGDDLFLFASELKAIAAFEGFSQEIDYEALSLYLHYQYVPEPRTIFKDTFKLLPGHYGIISEQQVKTDRYWNFPDLLQPVETDEKSALDRLDALLTQSVSDRLISDVPLGALLSGGIDSSLVVAMMQKASITPVKTFTIGFEQAEFDESPWAAKIAEHLNTEHHPFFVTSAEARNVIPTIPEIYDEPFADVSAIPTILVSKLARSKVTVALSGDGGDEQFGGYVRYWMTLAMKRFKKYLPQTFARAATIVSPQLLFWIYRPWMRFLPQRYRVENFFDKWDKYSYLMGVRELSELYRMTVCLWTPEEVEKLIGNSVPMSRYESEFDTNRQVSDLSRMMRVDMKTYLPGAMLTKVDRASMASGLEVRVPFLDHRVVEYTTTLSNDLTYRNGSGKYLLKKLLERYLPLKLFNRPKMGFGVPMGEWFRNDLKTLLRDYLAPDRLKRTGWLDPVYVEQKIEEHMAGRINHQYRLWSLLVWEMWAERWINGS